MIPEENRMDFTKMHGAGNDFIMLNNISESLNLPVELITALCARHFGIGADGLIILKPSSKYNFRMVYYNSDGSRAGMCGNGARCAARFAVDQGIAPRKLKFESDSGIVEAEVAGEWVEISMGEVRELRLNIDVDSFRVSYAVAGVPHAVLFSGDDKSPDQSDFLNAARKIRHHKSFEPDGTNVNLAVIRDQGSLSYRTYERGVEAETMACGTGAVAVSVIAAHLGMVKSPVDCRAAGGDTLRVSFIKKSYGAAKACLKGPAVETYSGSVDVQGIVRR
ncbi:MAG: diaminopimelate epimerase [Candidatus Latescibacteria bacterium]|nr:diaminopimelate epimerase [bacterium]MBD3423021.1 diaminopimelate epimerase [Candidatus Latescibacterota bacterium]